MKVVILAGGFGTRLSEETEVRPKPMVEIGGKPILWHIMKIYSHFGFNEFVICLGYKGYLIKEYFANYFLHMADVTFDMRKNAMEVHNQTVEPWKVTLVDTGANTNTGGRLKRIEKYVGDRFMATYGDGLSDVDISRLVDFHVRSGRIGTMTVVQPTGRFGAVDIDSSNGAITQFREKPPGDGAWVNAGFFVFEKAFLKYIGGDESILEREPLEKLAAACQLGANKHDGFWKPMDTLREKVELEALWQKSAPWKVWE